MTEARITLAHGAGGERMRRLIEEELFCAYGNDHLARREDQARLGPDLLAPGERLAFTTDAFVVDPLFFPGGDIGALGVNGTVNDLAVGGARPLYLACAWVIEEGLPLSVLRRVAASLGRHARRAGVDIVTGDTKVVPRGAADGLFLTTSGIGSIPAGLDLGPQRVRPGDRVWVNGPVGEHGAAILAAREGLAMEGDLRSDCQALHELVQALLAACPGLRCLRDATRGGVAAVLNEFAVAGGFAVRVHEAAVPVRDGVRGLCEILGFDPLYLANEGRLVAIVPPECSEALEALTRVHVAASGGAFIGEILPAPAGRVTVATPFGGERLLDAPQGELLPRIC